MSVVCHEIWILLWCLVTAIAVACSISQAIDDEMATYGRATRIGAGERWGIAGKRTTVNRMWKATSR